MSVQALSAVRLNSHAVQPSVGFGKASDRVSFAVPRSVEALGYRLAFHPPAMTIEVAVPLKNGDGQMAIKPQKLNVYLPRDGQATLGRREFDPMIAQELKFDTTHMVDPDHVLVTQDKTTRGITLQSVGDSWTGVEHPNPSSTSSPMDWLTSKGQTTSVNKGDTVFLGSKTTGIHFKVLA